MSGPKQHYIPQCFQRPFKIKGGGKAERVWCYRKGHEAPFPGRIADIAAERYFYSEKPSVNEITLDEIITKYENRLGHLLRELRSLSGNDTVPSEIAAEVIAHLTFRAKTIRHLMKDGFSGLLEGLSNLLEKGFDVKDFPAAPIPNGLETKLKEMLVEHTEFAEVNLLDKTLSRIAYAYVREHSDVILDDAQALISDFLFFAKSYDLRDSHAKSFQTMFPQKVFAQLLEMSWDIHELTGDLAILPDCIGVMSKNGTDFEPIVGGTLSATVIIVPITPDKLLVGSKDFEFDLNIDRFNEFAVGCSGELFISNKERDDLKVLQKKIGQAFQSIITSAIDDAINELTIEYSMSDTLQISGKQENPRQNNIRLTLSCEISEARDKEQIEIIAKEIVSIFDRKNLMQLASIHFGDQSAASQAYAETHLTNELINGSQRMRSDGICAVLPSAVEANKYDLHINHRVFELFLDNNEKINAVDYIKRAESDLLLTPIFERYDAGEFGIVDQTFIVPAIRSLRAFNRVLNTKNDTIDLSYLAEKTKSELVETWEKKDIENIKERHQNEADVVSEILERMSYSMVVLSSFAAQARSNLVSIALEVCDSPEFVRWITLFDKDMRLAIKWLRDNNKSDAGLIAAAHLERLMFGAGMMFESENESNVRYEFRGGFPQDALPIPFDAIIDLKNNNSSC